MTIRAFTDRLPRAAAWSALTLKITLLSTTAAAEIVPLRQSAEPVELVDTEERISGNAATGFMLVEGDFRPDRHNLWAYLGTPVPAAVELQISSVDGRYVARVQYDTQMANPGWNALELDLVRFDVLQSYARDSLDRVSALLIERDGATTFPLWWGPDHEDVDSLSELPALTAATRLQAYINSERATAFVVAITDGVEAPEVCRDVPGNSSFKFNALCEFSLGGISYGRSEPGQPIRVEGFDVMRRAGRRTLTPIPVTLNIEY